MNIKRSSKSNISSRQQVCPYLLTFLIDVTGNEFDSVLRGCSACLFSNTCQAVRGGQRAADEIGSLAQPAGAGRKVTV